MAKFHASDDTVLPVIMRARGEILDDISAGIVPPTVASFSELHDYVDANEYGGACEEGCWTWETVEKDDGETHCAFWNCVQDSVDQWLKGDASRVAIRERLLSDAVARHAKIRAERVAARNQ